MATAVSIVAALVISLASNVQAASIFVSDRWPDAEAPSYTDADTGHLIVGTPTNPWGSCWKLHAGYRLEALMAPADPDPFIMFAGAVIDAGAASTFGFTFILPLAPIVPNPLTVLDSLSGSVGNGPGSAAGGVTVTAAVHLVPS